MYSNNSHYWMDGEAVDVARLTWHTQSYFSTSASNNITKTCEYLACVKIIEKCSQASPAKLLTFMRETYGLPQTGTCFICY